MRRRTLEGAALVALAGLAACGDGGVTEPPLAGALISARIEGRVGYLLDELPMGMRDRVAEQLIAQPETAWQERARAQVALTGYRLAFRDAFYEEEEAKGQLPLPPAEKWRVSLLGNPQRVELLDHDLVLVDYALETTLLTDVDSPEASDPELANVGGSWDEPFVLPLDPELLLQRTGYACMDEDQFPPNSVDGENVATFYDQDCEGGEDSGCHITEAPDESCLEALDRSVGSLSVDLHFERIAWDPALAEQARVGDAGRAGADLEVIGEGLDNRRIIYRYIGADSCAMAEGCVTGLGWRRLLQFDASIKNIGADALHIGDVDLLLGDQDTLLASHNIFVYSACHEHYHFGHYGEFELDTAGETLGNKQAFCVQSTARYSNNETSPLTHPYGSCDYQGIQAGWGDDYGAGIECQWIDVSDVAPSAPVSARLDFKLNPDQFLCEGSPVLDAEGEPIFEDSGFRTSGGLTVDRPECSFHSNWDANNEQSRPVTINPTGSFVTEPCTRGQIGPLRDCGFEPGVEAVTELVCAPGATLNLRCSMPSGGAPAVVRVCEYSEKWDTGVACVYRDALANALVDSGLVDFTVTCPEARDAIEVGGHVALYSAPAFPGDELAVSCSVR
jgi:hypothetical protein